MAGFSPCCAVPFRDPRLDPFLDRRSTFFDPKALRLVVSNAGKIPTGRASQWIAQLVQTHVISNWLQQDVPEHLLTIQNRITSSKKFARLLELYRDVLRMKGVAVNDSAEQTELRLSGLVIREINSFR